MDLTIKKFKDLYGEYDLDLTVTFHDCDGPKWINDKKVILQRIGLLIAMHLHKTSNTGWDDLSEYIGWVIYDQLQRLQIHSRQAYTVIFHQFILARGTKEATLRTDSRVIQADVKFPVCDNVYAISYKATFEFTHRETRAIRPDTSKPFPLHKSYNQNPEWHRTVSKILKETDTLEIGVDLLNKLCTTIFYHISSAIEDVPCEEDQD